MLSKIKFIPSVFQRKYRIDPSKQIRQRSFDSLRFFMTIIQLISGCNGEGYHHALTKTFFGLDESIAPSKSAFCNFRNKISYTFFKDCFEKLISEFEQVETTYLGLRIYAIDGQQLVLPRSKEIIKHGFSGRSVSKYRETYMPRGYLTHMYDVLSGISKGFTFNPTLNEHADGRCLLKSVKEKCLVIYDRLYFSKETILQHFAQKTYFLMRCRTKANKHIDRFFDSSKKSTSFKYNGHRLYLFKIKHPKTGESNVFVTNLPRRWRKSKIIRGIYRLRWEVETFFKELTGITKAEQWHSKNYNGILQELYARFWKINFTKISMAKAGQKPLDPDKDVYKKANFKLIYNFIGDWILRYWKKLQYLIAYVKPLIRRSTEKRKRWSRSYERVIKSPASPYKYDNTDWYWELK